jgi:hypothetical protein
VLDFCYSVGVKIRTKNDCPLNSGWQARWSGSCLTEASAEVARTAGCYPLSRIQRITSITRNPESIRDRAKVRALLVSIGEVDIALLI